MNKRIYIFLLIFLVVAFSYSAHISIKELPSGKVMDVDNLERREAGKNLAITGK